MLTLHDRAAARDVVVASLPTMTREKIDAFRRRAEEAPAFGFPLRLLASVAEEVLRTADLDGFPHGEALGVFALRVESRRAPECAVVDRVLAEEEAQDRRRDRVSGRGAG